MQMKTRRESGPRDDPGYRGNARYSRAVRGLRQDRQGRGTPWWRILTKVVAEVSVNATWPSAKLCIPILAPIPAFNFRALAVRRLVTNLVDNAARYGSGEIQVKHALPRRHRDAECARSGARYPIRGSEQAS